MYILGEKEKQVSAADETMVVYVCVCAVPGFGFIPLPFLTDYHHHLSVLSDGPCALGNNTAHAFKLMEAITRESWLWKPSWHNCTLRISNKFT